MNQFYLQPFKTKAKGFNTEFSVHDLHEKVRFGHKLDMYEQQFVDHLKSQNLWETY